MDLLLLLESIGLEYFFLFYIEIVLFLLKNLLISVFAGVFFTTVLLEN